MSIEVNPPTRRIKSNLPGPRLEQRYDLPAITEALHMLHLEDTCLKGGRLWWCNG